MLYYPINSSNLIRKIHSGGIWHHNITVRLFEEALWTLEYLTE